MLYNSEENDSCEYKVQYSLSVLKASKLGNSINAYSIRHRPNTL